MRALETYVAKDGTTTFKVRLRTNGRQTSETFDDAGKAEEFPSSSTCPTQGQPPPHGSYGSLQAGGSRSLWWYRPGGAGFSSSNSSGRVAYNTPNTAKPTKNSNTTSSPNFSFMTQRPSGFGPAQALTTPSPASRTEPAPDPPIHHPRGKHPL